MRRASYTDAVLIGVVDDVRLDVGVVHRQPKSRQPLRRVDTVRHGSILYKATFTALISSHLISSEL